MRRRFRALVWAVVAVLAVATIVLLAIVIHLDRQVERLEPRAKRHDEHCALVAIKLANFVESLHAREPNPAWVDGGRTIVDGMIATMDQVRACLPEPAPIPSDPLGCTRQYTNDDACREAIATAWLRAMPARYVHYRPDTDD